MYYPNGRKYSGEFALDLPNGKGNMFLPNGDRYEGDVRDGLRHGYGVTYFANGDVTDGSFADGHPIGVFNYTEKNGNRYRHYYENGKIVKEDKLN
jgi:hypothetical protein